MTRRDRIVLPVAVFMTACALLGAQAPATPARQKLPGAWRNVGAPPCVAPDGGTLQCPPAATRVTALRAGRLFDSETGTMLTRHVILVQGEHILDVGPESRVKAPAGAAVIDLSDATVLPGLIDANTHMFNTPEKATTRERAVRWDDPGLEIEWPDHPRAISPRDAAIPDFDPGHHLAA